MQAAQFQLHARIEDRHWWFVARRQILHEIVRATIPAQEGHTVVDVGCGTGANLAGLALDYHCIGIDTSAEAIRLARQRFPDIQFLRGFAPDDLGEITGRTSLLMLNDVLEHVSDDFALFSDLLAALPTGAYFLVTVPADMKLWSRHDESFGHYRRYDVPRLAAVWEGLPVEPVFVSHFNARLYPAIRAVRTVNRLRGDAAGEVGTDFRMPTKLVNDLLTRTFGGESGRLARLARGQHARPYRRGVSLMALLQRTAGPMKTRRKPVQVAPDVFDPAAELALV